MFNNVDRFVKKISKLKLKSFSGDLLRKINMCLQDKNAIVKVDKNELSIKCDNKQINVLLGKDGLSYEMKSGSNVSVSGKYVNYKNGYYAQIIEEEKLCHDIGDTYSHNNTKKEVFRLFNKNGIEKFKRTTTKLDNYYEDKETGKISLHAPNILENYTDNSYVWRVDDKYIIKRSVRNYVYPDGTVSFIDIKNSDDCYIRYQTVDSKIKEIPVYGNFYGIDNNVFFDYFQSKASIDDVIENFHSKKYIKSSSI